MRDARPLKVIHNHLGFRNRHGKKRVIVPDVPEAAGIFGGPIFQVFEQNRFSQEPLNSTAQHEYVHRAGLRRVRGDFGAWWVGDFSDVRGNGIYQAFCGNEAGPSFAIRDDVWCRVLPLCIRYFQVQSCGRDVPGWHDACHLDDGYIPELDTYVDAKGGWHDAGDFRKWVSSTSLIPISLLVAHRIWKGREEKLGLEPGILLREAMQGVHYFLNMQDPDTGALYNNVGAGRDCRHDNLENRYTDNVPRSGDERRIFVRPPNTPAKYTTLLALYADALRGEDPDLSARCLAAALKSLACDANRNAQTADALQWRAWGLLEIWRSTADEQHRTAAVEALEKMLDLQVTEFVGGQDLTRGFFRADFEGDRYHHKHIGADYPVWVIGEFLDAFGDHPQAARWKDAVALWVDDYVKVFVERNPFGLLPYAFYSAPSPRHPDCVYRRIGERLYFRYFLADNKFGTNARSSLSAAALAAAARVLGRGELLDDAYRLLEWTLGANPFQVSTMTGFGAYQASALSFQMGDIPGGVTMGIGGDDSDMPRYDNPWHCWDEYYGYQTSQFFWAAAALQDLSW